MNAFANLKNVDGYTKKEIKKLRKRSLKMVDYEPSDPFIKDTMIKSLISIGFPTQMVDVNSSKLGVIRKIRIESALDFFLSKGIFIEIEGPFPFTPIAFYRYQIYFEDKDKNLSEGAKMVNTKTYQGGFNAAAFIAGSHLKSVLKIFSPEDIKQVYSKKIDESILHKLRTLAYNGDRRCSYFEAMRFLQEQHGITIGLLSKSHPDEDGVVGDYRWVVKYCYEKDHISVIKGNAEDPETMIHDVILNATNFALNLRNPRTGNLA